MSISAADVKKLRDMTGAGMMDAKKALSESNGDFDNAVKYLREKGLADSKKRADKEANQGTIGDYIHFQQDRAVAGVLVELACETDFVAKSDEFKNVAKQVAMHIAALKPEFLNVEDVPSERIEEEKVRPRSRMFFQGRECIIWTLWLISMLVGTLAVAITLYVITHHQYALYEATHENFFTFLV